VVEPEDISELKDLYRSKLKENHSLSRRETDILIEGNEVAYLLIPENIRLNLTQEMFYGKELIEIV